MLHKTEGIVFRFTKYGETSIIVTIFTELFGLQSYIVNGVRSSSAKSKIALYQPLTLLDLVVYYRENANIKRIKEVKCLYPYHDLHRDVKKSMIGMFMNEVVNKTVKDESHARELYEFIRNSLMKLDSIQTGFENFHLIFLIKLSRLLGFGVFRISDILQGSIIGNEDETKLSSLLESDYETPLAIPYQTRKNLLDLLLKFYSSHLENLGEFKSVQVLKEVIA